ncbi:protein DEEPER ROOTING 1 [Lactuca sativa]|uniref:protein DEEPER ROOTING 1 n=1 Tax=Lactuca sativa TaxID=4236 RepID=UPI0022AE8900|nr:protein DEEPER ROOTING 1 [Lactuca sativa]
MEDLLPFKYFKTSSKPLCLRPSPLHHHHHHHHYQSTTTCCPSLSITTTIMKFISWMQSKINGGQGYKNTNTPHHTKHEPQKEEFSDWPQGLLTIGTFGNNDLPIENEEIQETRDTETISSPDLSEFTPEEIGKLQNELTKLLSKKPAANTQEAIDLPLDRFLNCPSSLEVDRRLSLTVNDHDENNKEEDIDRTIRVILGRCKDICMNNTSKKAIGKKSISFIFKKMFACSSGFPAIPSLRDPLPESKMEKLLRAMLKNKINPQNSSQSSSRTKFIEGKRQPRKVKVTENENEKDGSKWVKTDSEFIVLEI